MPLSLPPSVDLREVGLRDGLQLEAPLPLAVKRQLLDHVIATGIRRIEATSFVSPTAVPALADAEQLAAGLDHDAGIRFSALVAGVGGARRAVAAGVVELEYVISASDGHSRANVGRSTDEAVALTAPIAALAHDAGGRCEAIIACAWDCPFDGPTAIERTVDVAVRAVALGADRLCIADTIGSTVPGRVATLIEAVRAACPDVELGIHLHDTRGAGIACVLAAVQLGVTQIDASLGGLGGCPFAPGATGNIATEEVVHLLEGSGVRTGIDLGRTLDAARAVEAAVGHPLPSRLHRAGIATPGRAEPTTTDRG